MTDNTHQHQRLIYYWAMKVLHNHHDALEASQDVFIKLMSFDEEKKSSPAWMRKITVNHCIDLIRKNKSQSKNVTLDQNNVPVANVEDKNSTWHEDEQSKNTVHAISELSDMQQIVILAKIFDRETFAAISKKLKISESAAKTHYFRGIKKLQSILENNDG